MRPRALRLTALALLLSTGACFHYIPSQGAPSRGTPVQVALSRPLPVQLSALTANNVVEVRGELVSAGPGNLVLSVFALRTEGGVQYRSLGETVALPTDAVADLAERRFSLARTVLGTAVLTAAGYLLQLTLRGAVGGGENGGGGGDSR